MGYMHYDIKPDIVTMAKAMGGGMPIGAVCATKEAASAFTKGAHGTTYGGNPVCCAASYAQIKELLERDLAKNAKEMGEYFMDRLRALPLVKEVRGLGLLVGVEFTKDIAVDIKHGCLDRKMLITAIGGKVIRMVPPLIATKEDCDMAYEVIRESIEGL
jgi:acetylornithine/N-succinyldiaminopimelate aminotransferase